ncbi:protein of unknown function [Magnetospirillum sp. XM-1]|nr:protein of unknown function [Magnetospirillum sp. XM-1]
MPASIHAPSKNYHIAAALAGNVAFVIPKRYEHPSTKRWIRVGAYNSDLLFSGEPKNLGFYEVSRDVEALLLANFIKVAIRHDQRFSPQSRHNRQHQVGR